jgi:HAMP domain-containing protein
VSIKLRLLLGKLFNILIVMTVGYFAVASTQQIKADYQRLSLETLPVIEALEELRFNVLRVISSTSEAGLLITLGEAEEAEDSVSDEGGLAQQGAANLRVALNQYRNLVGQYFPEDLSQANIISFEAEILIGISNQFFDALDRSVGPSELMEFKEKLEASEQRLLQLIQDVLYEEEREIEERSVLVVESVHNQQLILSLGIVLIIMTSLILAWHNRRYISLPLEQLKMATRRISEGRLDNKLPTDSSDEMGELFNDINQMASAIE